MTVYSHLTGDNSAMQDHPNINVNTLYIQVMHCNIVSNNI